jgi:hypothetical protein
MSIVDLVKQGVHIARTHKSLWLFAFVVGLGSVSGGGGNRGAGGGPAAGGGPGLPVAVIVACVIVVVVAAIVMKFVSEGAMIEGVTRARRNETLTMREGFRVGWSHCGVLFRIGALYVAATLGGLMVLAAPWVIALLFGAKGWLWPTGVLIPLIAAPLTITLYVLQSLASRIAVLENRHAVDAIRKARLFLHGRMLLALKLMFAGFVGTLVVTLVGLAVLAPLALLLVALAKVLGGALTLAIGLLVIVPTAFVAIAFIGTVQSAAWTLGYLEQVGR